MVGSGQGTNYRVFLIDVETKGLNPEVDRLVETAVLRYDLNQTPESMYPLSTLVKQCEAVPGNETNVHGITKEMTENSPSFPGAWERVVAYVTAWVGAGDGVVLVAHNARFDGGSVCRELMRYGLPVPDWKITCSLRIASSLCPFESSQLASLAFQAGVDEYFLKGAHRAKNDVRLLAKVLDRIANSQELSSDSFSRMLFSKASMLSGGK